MHMLATPLIVLLMLLLATAAVTDIRSRIIPNWLNAAVALLAVPWWFAMGWGGTDILIQIGLALGVLVVFAACFALGMMGGGDVKLLVALALWLPFVQMANLLVWMALGGGVLTVVMMIVHRLRNAPDRVEVPYGVAIVGAALLIVANDILTTTAA